jgi:hypothetical protein
MSKPEFETLADAKQYLRENWQEGVECPCCTQLVKLYPYKPNSTAISDLIRLWNASGRQLGIFVHVREFSHDRGGAFAKLAHWGLVESQINEDTQKRTSGMWTITDSGRQFVVGLTDIPERAYLFNSKSYGMSRKRVNVRQALGNKFNYEELMAEYSLAD